MCLSMLVAGKDELSAIDGQGQIADTCCLFGGGGDVLGQATSHLLFVEGREILQVQLCNQEQDSPKLKLSSRPPTSNSHPSPSNPTKATKHTSEQHHPRIPNGFQAC